MQTSSASAAGDGDDGGPEDRNGDRNGGSNGWNSDPSKAKASDSRASPANLPPPLAAASDPGGAGTSGESENDVAFAAGLSSGRCDFKRKILISQ